VHARKPDLFQLLAADIFLLSPHAGLEGPVAFVDGQGMKGVVDAAAQVHVMEFDVQELVGDVLIRLGGNVA
jgi:hypothetical protein